MTSSGADGLLALDTSAYRHLRTGHAGVVSLLTQAVVVVVPAIVLGELEAAFRGGSRLLSNLDELDAFLSRPWVVVGDVTRDVTRRYGQVTSELRQRGTPVPSNDVWIAATSMSMDARLITFDTDFARIPGLDVVVLQP